MFHLLTRIIKYNWCSLCHYALTLILQLKYLICMLIFIKFTKAMHVASKFIIVDVARNQYIASKFIRVDAVWLGGMSPTSKYKRKISIDWLVTKFTKRYLILICNFLCLCILFIIFKLYLLTPVESLYFYVFDCVAPEYKTMYANA